MNDWQPIRNHLSEALGEPVGPLTARPVGGGCINQTLVLSDGRRRWFLKCNAPERLDMFEAEADGLAGLAASATLRVPRPICHGLTAGQSYLVLEFIDLGAPRRGSEAEAGRGLAALHRSLGGPFGWRRDNVIGATPQPNGLMPDWVDFWRERRLGFQLRLAAENGFGGELQRRGERLLERFPALIDHHPAPSLLHGDLWGGNLAYDGEGRPVIFDPAVYYGDREVDLAMTELFGGFGPAFYDAYREAWPLDPGYGVRKTLYNLYHILNHANLFGGSYLRQALSMIERLLAAC